MPTLNKLALQLSITCGETFSTTILDIQNKVKMFFCEGTTIVCHFSLQMKSGFTTVKPLPYQLLTLAVLSSLKQCLAIFGNCVTESVA